MISTVLFDFDGTLVHTAPGILAGFRQSLDEAGIVPIEPIDARVIGPPLMTTLARLTGLTDGPSLARLAQAFKCRYDAEGVLNAEPYPALHDVLKELATAGRRIFVVTNKRQVPARRIAERLAMMPLLAGLYSLDTFDPPAQNKAAVVAHLLAEHRIDPSATVLVGDSIEDAEAAEANGLRFIAATYGYGTPAALPAATLGSLAELPAMLGRLA